MLSTAGINPYKVQQGEYVKVQVIYQKEKGVLY